MEHFDATVGNISNFSIAPKIDLEERRNKMLEDLTTYAAHLYEAAQILEDQLKVADDEVKVLDDQPYLISETPDNDVDTNQSDKIDRATDDQ